VKLLHAFIHITRHLGRKARLGMVEMGERKAITNSVDLFQWVVGLESEHSDPDPQIKGFNILNLKKFQRWLQAH
jgi:hypothetical protein